MRINVALLTLLLVTAVTTAAASSPAARELRPNPIGARVEALQATPAPGPASSESGADAARPILLRLFGLGAAAAAFSLLTFAAYQGLRGRARRYLARRRNRRLHQDRGGHRARENRF